MVSLYMPDVVVEIAFNSGYVTPAASRTWTDVSSYVELADRINTDIARGDELSTADANTLTLTLDNSDGRFTALRAASPYYPNVKIGRPIRVKVTPPGGTTVTRFVGFIDEWPVEWDGTDAYAKASIRATSRMARLGLTAKLKSIVEQEILALNPARYYTLGDPSGSSSASESSGNGGTLLQHSTIGTVSPTFGATTGVTDGLTGVTFPPGSRTLNVDFPGMTVGTLRVCFNVASGNPAGAGDTMAAVTGGATVPLVLGFGYPTDSYGVWGGTSPTALQSTTDAAAPGVPHDLVVTSSVADGMRLYLDGVQVDTAAGVDFTGKTGLRVGNDGWDVDVSMCHVAIYPQVLTAGEVAALADATLDGFAGDRTDQRLLRLLEYVGVASTEVDVETGVETMTYQLTSGMSVLDALRECESTEGGVLFDGADGDVKFHNRSHRYLSTAAATLDMAAQHVEADYAPKLDRSTLVNDITVDNPTTGETARQVDTTSSDEYGIATGSATSVADSYDPLTEKASWHIVSYAEPRMRCPSLTVNVLAHQGLTPSAQTLLGITVGDLLAVSNAPSQSDTTSPKYFVEGYTESIGPESYFITFNLSPTYPTLNTLILDSATRGLLDTDILAY